MNNDNNWKLITITKQGDILIFDKQKLQMFINFIIGYVIIILLIVFFK